MAWFSECFVPLVLVLVVAFLPLVQAPEPTGCQHLLGDVNGDGRVSILDYSILAEAWGSRRGDERYNVRCDFDCDGTIGDDDLAILQIMFGKER